jgi:dUTP pyrophosphatase
MRKTEFALVAALGIVLARRRRQPKIAITVSEDAVAPARTRDEDIGYDLVSTIGEALWPGARVAVPTGVTIQLPPGVAALVLPRSGLAAKHGISIVNSPGLIDPGYTGEIKVLLCNLGEEEFQIEKGMRIAQLLFVETMAPELQVVAELAPSVRGSRGFGSSGH